MTLRTGDDISLIQSNIGEVAAPQKPWHMPGWKISMISLPE